MDLQLVTERVDVYKNLHWSQDGKTVYSIREHGGRVLDHQPIVILRDCTMTVQPAGRRAVAAGGPKNVHAWITGVRMFAATFSHAVQLRYDPRLFETFVVASTGEPVHRAALVRLDGRGVFAVL